MMFPVDAKDYMLYEQVGEGASATVYRALCIPLNKIIAIKVLDLDKCNLNLDGIYQEIKTMSTIDHPNVLRAHVSFTTGHYLWVVMPYLTEGSCLQIIKSDYPEGFEEPVIAILLHEILKALVYLHSHGNIHRDVKAGNILVNSDGSVKLGDFGVAACMFEHGERKTVRKTFVGTPCWMAPEVMAPECRYDYKADIWSLGITALELAHGHAPFSIYPPIKVLLMTLTNEPPGLDYERDVKFSRSFRQLIASCLVKDPTKRPSAEKLLKHSFFKRHIHSKGYLARTILKGLLPLSDRFKILKTKEAALLLQNKALINDEKLSQEKYMHGISAWDFNLEALKMQASFITEDENGHDDVNSTELTSPEEVNNSDFVTHKEDELNDFEDPLAVFPIKAVLGIRKTFDIVIDEDNEGLKDHNSNLNLGQKKVQENIPHLRPNINHSAPLQIRQRKDINEEDAIEGTIIQRKGRFKVTSADLGVKGPTNNSVNPVSPTLSTTPNTPTLSHASILSSLQCIMQQNINQRDDIIKMIKYVEMSSGNLTEIADVGPTDISQILSSSSAREKELQSQVIELQQSVGSIVEELQSLKMKNEQLEKKLSSFDEK